MFHGDQGKRDQRAHQESDQGLRAQGRGERDRRGPLDGRRHRPRVRPRAGPGGRAGRVPRRHPRDGAQPRGGQRRRRPHGRGRAHQGRGSRQAHRAHRRGAGRRGPRRPRRQRARPADRRKRRDRRLGAAPDRDQGAGHRRAPAGEGAAADRHQGHRLDDPDRPRAARADHRRPPDRQDRGRDRHDHQPEGAGRLLHLRRHRPEAVDGGAGRGEAPPARRDGLHHRRRRDRLRPRAAAVHRPLRRAARWASTSATTACTR